MDSDLSHEALKRFNELDGWVGQLFERIKRLEEHLGVDHTEDVSQETEEQQEDGV